jgi:hypothetical protein
MSAAPTSEIQHVQTQPIEKSGAMDSLSMTQLRERLRCIQQVLTEVMVEDVDYGTIPGCGDKKALFKSGAELICTTFKLVPKFEITTHDLPNGHREYQVLVTLMHGPTQQFWGQGVGMCTTMEGKYRYRGTQVEPTGVDLPRNYWDLKDFAAKEKCLAAAMNSPNGKDFTHKKIDGRWQICRKTAEKMENSDPADQFNTALKMGKKRGLVDAVLTATAASRMFSQDIEDEDVEEAKPVQSRTVNGSQQQTPRYQQAIAAFADFNANQKDLEELVTRGAADWTDADFEVLESSYAAIKKGDKNPGDYFPRLASKVEEQAPQQTGKQGSMFGNSANQAAFKK